MLSARFPAVIAAAALIVCAAASLPAAGEPPPVRVRTGPESQSISARSWCWPQATGPPMCQDGHFIPNPTTWLPVDPRHGVRLDLPDTPRKIRVQVWEPLPSGADIRQTPHGRKVTETMVPPQTKALWHPRLEDGRYVVSFGVFWPDRQASWVAGIEIGEPSRSSAWAGAALAGAAVTAAAAGAWGLRRRRRGAARA